jgi:hypothetical protein
VESQNPREELLTTDQVMDRLLAEPALRRKAMSCVLGAVKCGTEYRFRKSDLESWIARQLGQDSKVSLQ